MDKRLLVKIFFDKLRNATDSIGMCYYRLFEIQGNQSLESTFEWLYGEYVNQKNSPKEEQMWFYQFHKSIRQTDFFSGCTKTTSKSLLTPEEKMEMITLAENINAEWQKVKSVHKKTEPNLTIHEYFKRAYPESHKRHQELKVKHLNEETENIGGSLDSVLWNLIHMDNKNFLMLTMLRSFKEHDLEMEMLEELKNIENDRNT